MFDTVAAAPVEMTGTAILASRQSDILSSVTQLSLDFTCNFYGFLITFFEKTRIQMEYVVPLIQDLQDVLGKDTVLEALEEVNRRRFERTPRGEEPDFGRVEEGARVYAEGDAIEYDVIASSADRFDLNIRHCRC